MGRGELTSRSSVSIHPAQRRKLMFLFNQLTRTQSRMKTPNYMALKTGHLRISTRPSVMGPMMSSLPSERRAAELMLLSVVNAWPPHHAVRR